MPPQTRPNSPPPPSRFRYSIGALLLAVTLLAVPIAGGAYLWSAARGNAMSRGLFFAVVLIAPLGAGLAIALLLGLFGLSPRDSDDPPDGPHHLVG